MNSIFKSYVTFILCYSYVIFNLFTYILKSRTLKYHILKFFIDLFEFLLNTHPPSLLINILTIKKTAKSIAIIPIVFKINETEFTNSMEMGHKITLIWKFFVWLGWLYLFLNFLHLSMCNLCIKIRICAWRFALIEY